MSGPALGCLGGVERQGADAIGIVWARDPREYDRKVAGADSNGESFAGSPSGLRALLAQEGWSVSRKQVQRIRRKEGLKVRPKPQKIPRQWVSTGLPTQAHEPNQVWTWDFIFDRTNKGSTLKMLTMLDEYSPRCLAIRVERQIQSEHVLFTLWQAMTTDGIPRYFRSDNGSEFIAQKIQTWLRERQIRTLYIDPGTPWQNGYIESYLLFYLLTDRLTNINHIVMYNALFSN